MATKLNKIPVLFDQESHTYTNTDTFDIYKGITSTLLNRLFPNKYAGISEVVLAKAARYGTLVHEDIELAESFGVKPTTEEGENYLKLKEEHELRYLASEYTVSDMEHYATNIDCIYDVDENLVDLADFKTTYKLDKDYLSWQLSICAYFFEKNNPYVKVRNLYGIWLRGDIAQLVKVPRRTDEEVLNLIFADINDLPFEYKPIIPAYVNENEMTIIACTKRIKELQEELEAAKAEVMANMEKDGAKSIDTGALLITVVAASKKSTFDSKRFKEENEELYGKYMKESETKASLKVTVR